MREPIYVEDESFGTLCICALRYCHGRMTYMPSMVIGIVGAHMKDISDKDLAVMIDDCCYQRHFDLYGDAINKADWLKWEQRLLEEKERRKAGGNE